MNDYADPTNLVGPSGGQADVKDNCLLVKSKSAFDQAVEDGRAFSFASVTYDPGAHDTILGVYNEDPDQDFHVQTIIASSDTASQIQVFEAAAVTMAGTAVPSVNLNRSCARVARATAKCHETGNGEQGAGYPKLFFRDLLVANIAKQIAVNGRIVLACNQMIGVDLTTAATAGNVTIIGWFE